MSEHSNIEWTDATFNPWEGCTKVGPGCDNCYAERRNARFGGGQAINWGPGTPRRRTGADNWRKPVAWNRAAAAFFALHGRRRRVFCSSLADVFDNEVPASWRADLFALIEATPHLDWLLLTKRIGNAYWMAAEAAAYGGGRAWDPQAGWPNVWLGATVVNQLEYDRDIGKLLRTPAARHFLSVEPMLGPIDMRMGGASMPDYSAHRPLAPLDWVICGGESGPKARPMHIEWARSLMQQCKAAGVAFNMKQLGAQPHGWCAAQVHADPADREDDACDFYEASECNSPCPGRCAALVDKKGGDMAEWPEDLRVREFPAP